MATATQQTSGRSSRRVYSMPVLDGEVTLSTQQAQRVFHRGYTQAARALYVLDVVLRVTQKTNPNFKDAYDQAIGHAGSLIDTVIGDLEKERQRLAHLSESNNISGTARYSAAQTVTYAVSTPLAARFAFAVQALDEVVQLLDTLWLGGIITSHANSEGKYGYQRRLLRVVRTLVGFAINARKSARRAGQAEEVKAALGDVDEAALEVDAAMTDDVVGDEMTGAPVVAEAKDQPSTASKKPARAKAA